MFSNWALRSGWRGPIVFFFRAFRLRYPCLRSNWETTWRLTGVPSLGDPRGDLPPRQVRPLHLGPHRIAGGVVLEDLEEVRLDRRVGLDQPLASAPFFRTRPVSRSSVAFQFRQPPADGLGIAPQDAGDVLDPAVPQLRGLDGGIPPSIVSPSASRTAASSSVRFSVHRRPCCPPPGCTPILGLDIIFQANREVISVPFRKA